LLPLRSHRRGSAGGPARRRSPPLLALVCLVAAGPAAAAEPEGQWDFEPFLAVVGGVAYETIQHTEGADVEDEREDRPFTLGLSRFGLRGRLAGGFSLESEFEVNAGPRGHGAGLSEGQAALQVRNQRLRLERWGLTLDVGRVEDPASVDFFSAHVVDLLLTDAYTRGPLLASGLNRGNGISARYEVLDGLSLGLTVNAANPTSNTGILAVGGSYQPFERFFHVAVKDLGQDESHLPRDSMHFTIVSPSAAWTGEQLQARVAAQLFSVNHNTETDDVDTIDGYNLRAALRVALLSDRLALFANASRITNTVVNPRDEGRTIEGQDWLGTTVSGGLDVRLLGKSGVGAQYAYVRGQEGDQGTVRVEQFVNVGASLYLDEATAVCARLGIYGKSDTPHEGPELTSGLRSWFLTARTAF